MNSSSEHKLIKLNKCYINSLWRDELPGSQLGARDRQSRYLIIFECLLNWRILRFRRYFASLDDIVASVKPSQSVTL